MDSNASEYTLHEPAGNEVSVIGGFVGDNASIPQVAETITQVGESEEIAGDLIIVQQPEQESDLPIYNVVEASYQAPVSAYDSTYTVSASGQYQLSVPVIYSTNQNNLQQVEEKVKDKEGTGKDQNHAIIELLIAEDMVKHSQGNSEAPEGNFEEVGETQIEVEEIPNGK